MMGAPIGAVDHGIGHASLFVMQPGRDQPPDDRVARPAVVDDEICEAMGASIRQ